MKEEKPKLELNKRTIARLNNLEMRQVRGGDGETDISNEICVETDKKTIPPPPDPVKDLTAKITTIILTRLGC